jgi:hypothetical protein
MQDAVLPTFAKNKLLLLEIRIQRKWWAVEQQYAELSFVVLSLF